MYKILNLKTNLYSKGGVLPKFHPIGKTWRLLSHLKLHLRMISEVKNYNPYEDCVIVESIPKPNWVISYLTIETLMKEVKTPK